jgi:EAL domain-containing protein (putative c-di-GMP-specific phosphodiesterase class I)
MVALGRHVLRVACENLRRWQLSHRNHGELYVSVNLATHEIQDPHLLDEVKAVLAETGVAPSTLFLEITEGVLLDTDDEAIARLRELKELGVRLAVDDFGTGYSALSYLQRFPIDVLKVDKTFTSGLGALEQQRLVKGIIDLAHGVHLKTIAEGVETAEQAVALRTMNAEFAQGFYFARPMTDRQMEAMVSLTVAEAV